MTHAKPPYPLNPRHTLICLLMLTAPLAVAETRQNITAKQTQAKTDIYQGDDITVYSTATADRKFPNTAKATPSYIIDAEDVKTKINATTSDDFLRYAPGVQVRKRFIGDPTVELSMRGSNITQPSHTMVFADGMPLHNPVRAGAHNGPRWAMVSPNETESTQVLYGPFSAQYSGNSFGGVVNLTTKMPEKFEAELNTTGIFQDMHRGGRDELLTGYKTFLSAGDRMDKFSIYGSYNRLENEGHPQVIRTALPVTGAGTPVSGTSQMRDNLSRQVIAYGDNGVSQESTDLFKLKMGYDFTEDLQGRFTIGYEQDFGEVDDPNNLLRNAAGNPVFGGATATGLSADQKYTQNGQTFAVPGSAFSVSEAERLALNYGLNLKGKISDNWSIDTTASYYDNFKNRSVSSQLSPNHPSNRNKGQVTDLDIWWATYDLKLATDNFLGRDDLSFMGGYQFNHGNLNIDVFDSNDYRQQSTDTHRSDSGGQTETNAVFSQLEWRFLPDWSIMAGARLDHWQAIDGHVRTFDNPTTAANETNIQNYANRDASRISPKASLEYSPNDWTFRYSFSKAYRFPVAQELFASVSSLNNLSIAAPDLGPENGYFHNFMTQYDIPRGYVRANFFYDQINNEIANTLQQFGATQITTFLPIGQTETIGVDLTYQQNELFGLPVDLMANTTFMNKQITQNSRNPSLVGNEWNRIPRLQANASLTYHVLPAWDTSVGVRYSSDSFNNLENNDKEANVYTAKDEFTFVDLKTNYSVSLTPKLKSTLSAGIDNVFDVDAYDFHPFPQRTYYISASLKY